MTAMIEAIVFFFFWSSWSSGTRCGVDFFLNDSEDAAGVSGHDLSPHLCAAGARMSTVHDVCPTQATTQHATRVRSHWESG